MNPPAAHDIAPLPDDLSEDRARLDRQLARLDRLADLGLEIAEALAGQAKGEGPQVVEGDIALAYDRVARAVRMAVMLQSRLVADARLSRQAPAMPAADPAGARKDQISRIVKRIAQGDERLDGFQVGWAGREARERLEHDDVYGQVMSRPVSDVVADICRDLGLNPDWARLAREAWAQDEIAGGEAGEALQESRGAVSGPARAIPTLGESLQGLAADGEILAAARRESG